MWCVCCWLLELIREKQISMERLVVDVNASFYCYSSLVVFSMDDDFEQTPAELSDPETEVRSVLEAATTTNAMA